MAAPTTVPRLTPNGFKLVNGYRSILAFDRAKDIALWEKTVTPPGFDGGDPIDITTMHNDLVKTKAPQCLIDMTDAEMTMAYDPKVYTDIRDLLLNKPGMITVYFPDGATLDFFGYLRSFEPDPLTPGEQPEATVVVVITNYDPYNCVEALPVMNPAGTCTYPCTEASQLNAMMMEPQHEDSEMNMYQPA